MQHVILITPGFTADETDLNCLPTLQLYARALQENGVQVHIISLDYPFSREPYTWHGIPVYPCGGRNKRWLKIRTVMRALHIGHRLLDHYPDAVLHSFWLSWPCGVGERLAHRRGVRHITTLMGQDALPVNKKWFRFLHAERSGQFIVLSEYHQEILQKSSGFHAPNIIPWGAADDEIPAMVSRNRSIDVLGAGSLIPLKNWEKWLKTIALVKEKQPAVQATILGNGKQRKALEKLAKQFGLEKTVTFRGELPRPEVLETMQQSRVFLHTANFESQGYVLTEAGMSGCHLVSTPVGIAPQMCACAYEPEELAELVLKAMGQSVSKQLVPYKMSETVKTYLKHYFD